MPVFNNQILRLTAVLGLLIYGFGSYAQINPKQITIARDTFGVPHIFARTDAEAAYGLAYAHAEDDFEHIQHAMLAATGRLGRVIGLEGSLFDFALKFLKVDTLVESRYESDLTPEFRKVVEGYAQGLNAYAERHPKEIIRKKVFPIVGKDIIKGYILSTSLLAGLGMALKAVNENRIDEFFNANDVGSNAMAVAPSRMVDGKGYLLNNSHQPLEGRFAWYEAHVSSEEGWEIIGGLFPGGISIFVGTNRHLGWAHTTNYHNFGDIYKLEINPEDKNQYKYDGEWKDFVNEKIRLVVNLGGIRLPVKRKAQYCEYGPVFKTKHGKYAFRFPGYMDIRAAEQWFAMNKATDYESFYDAISMHAIPLFNIVYADVDGNILFHSSGQVPLRNSKLNWDPPITSNTSDYKWKELVPFERMPQVINPECGYVYNANNTPLNCTGDTCDWDDYFPGLQMFEYNRGEQFGSMLKSHNGKFTEADLNKIKFNKAYAEDGSYMDRFRSLYELDEAKYPEIADAIQIMKGWDLSGPAESTDAALAMVTHDFLRQKVKGPFALLMIRETKVSEADAVWAITEAKELLMKTHGTLAVPLGEVQRLIRGDKSYPASGLREVPRAADPKLHDKKKGIFKITNGDGYMQIVRFSKEGPEIRSVHPYGASSRSDSPHYTDQMELFTNQKFKMMIFEKDQILKTAERVYSPGE